MKKMLVVFLITRATQAADSVVFKAVLDSKEIASLEDIETIEVEAQFACQNCYTIKVSGMCAGISSYIFFATEQVGDQLIVKRVKGPTVDP